MVSQPEPSRSLSVRGPSSVVSRSSRHRRQNRSLAGGSSYIPQNEFPVFANTGDVEILVSAGGKENRYLLHRLILTQCSGFFEASTSQEWSRGHTEASKELARIGEDGGSMDTASRTSSSPQKQRWRYELDKGPDNSDIPMLVQATPPAPSLFNPMSPPPVRNKPPSSSTSFFRSVANLSIAVPAPLSQEDTDLLRDYDNLFRIFYNYPPSLDPINIADAYIQCKSLLALADMYDALVVVGPRIDHHLLQFQSRLFKQIAKYPPSYLRLGYMARSKVIFAEALIHVVGQWPVGERHLRQALPQQVVELIEDKVDELADVVAGVEGRLFRLSLLTSRGDRVSPQTSYVDWLAVSLFREWLAENTSSPPPAPAKPISASRPNTNPHERLDAPPLSANSASMPPPYSDPPVPYLGRVYRLLGSSSGSAYLGHEECKRFLKLTPELYSRETLRRFERKVEEVKALARETVAPLMRCTLQGGAEGVSYLTCTRIGHNDWVWENE
ncbi:hypothetical protein V501_07025 [Pseudogymnoascus sp. VKM F-4519 (FW-2642)]|nr:hypothetical protein V501_07025 [Pseudogymnoascus sp. VKM F-4519 (FW-2642)]